MAMNIDKSRLEKSNEIEVDLVSNIGHVNYSYRYCSFCKRGFSNAQALGGHMNIHRKDRAKLRHLISDDQNLLSLEIAKETADSEDYSSAAKEKLIGNRRTSETRNRQRSLLLSVEVPPPESGGEEAAAGNSHSDEHIIDLELRLGPEPYDHDVVKTKSRV